MSTRQDTGTGARSIQDTAGEIRTPPFAARHLESLKKKKKDEEKKKKRGGGEKRMEEYMGFEKERRGRLEMELLVR